MWSTRPEPASCGGSGATRVRAQPARSDTLSSHRESGDIAHPTPWVTRVHSSVAHTPLGPLGQAWDVRGKYQPVPTNNRVRPAQLARMRKECAAMAVVTMRELLDAGVHFGHQTRRWNPKMKRFIVPERNGIYIIDIQQSLALIDNAYEFVKETVAHGGSILYVGTKKQAQEPIVEQARRVCMPYVTERWLGGMLTNFQTVKASIDRLKKLEALKLTDNWNDYTKKEQSGFDRELGKLRRGLGGIQDVKKLPGAIFLIDTTKEHIAITEAQRLHIPTVAIVDTNCDPTGIDFMIPGNDDAFRSVSLFARMIADACLEGTQQFQEKLRAAGGAMSDKDDGSEKKISRFEGDIDLKGVDAAELAAMDQAPVEEADAATVAAVLAAAAATTKKK